MALWKLITVCRQSKNTMSEDFSLSSRDLSLQLQGCHYLRQTLLSSKKFYWWTYLQRSNGEQTYGHDWWGGQGEGRMCGESNMETYICTFYICTYVKSTANGSSLYRSGNSDRAPNNLEGWGGEGVGGRSMWEGTWVNLWLIHGDGRNTQYCKAITLQLKTNKIKCK